MDTFSSILSCINKQVGNAPYCLWIRKPEDRKFRPIHRERGCMAPAPLLCHTAFPEPCTIIRAGEYVHWVFKGEEEFLAAITIPGKDCPLSPEGLEHLSLLFQLYSCQQQLREKNLELAKLLEGIRSITASLEPEELLKKIISNALSVISGTDAGLLHLYDPAIDRLVPKAAVGFDQEAIQHFRLKIGESIAGKVFQDGHARLYRSTPEAQKGMKDISRKNYYYLNSAKKLSDLKGLLCVPISIGKERIGVLVLHQFDQDTNLTEHHLELLQGFADQTAITIQNARLYSETKGALQRLEQLSKQLTKEHENMRSRKEIHQTLTRLSLQNKGTSAIVAALNRMIEKPVYLIDYLENKYHPEQRESALILNADESARLFSSRQHPLFIDVDSDGTTKFSISDTMGRYYVYPIFNHTVFLGCLVVDTFDGTLSDLDHIAIEQGGSVIALELVKKQGISSIYYKKTHEFFQEILQNPSSEMLPVKGKEWGLDPAASYAVVLAKFTSHPDLQKLDAAVHRLVAKVKQQPDQSVRLVYGFHNHVTMLVSASSSNSLRPIEEMCRSLLKGWEWKESFQLCIGIGTPYSGIEQIRKSFDEAKKAADYLVSQHRSGIVLFSNLGINRLFVNQSPDELEAFVHDIFRGLWADKKSGKELEKTLYTYMASNRSVKRTANMLHIHVNTLYQRLRKIESLLNIRFNNPEDVLKVQLACHLKEVYGIRNRFNGP